MNSINESKQRRKIQIYHFLQQETENHSSTNISTFFHDGLQTVRIAEHLFIDRANVSRELNQLVKEALVLKIAGKPVFYFAKNVLETNLHITFDRCIFNNKDSFIEFIASQEKALMSNNKEAATYVTNQEQNTPPQNNHESAKEIFDTIIGANSSLKNQIKQAIAAIIYPPNGLHTFLIGPSGVGKTMFAELMYRYAIEIGRLKANAPYVIFNCADYAGNAQLLLSYLFGHVKGAFTGADKEKKGLIDEADGGILFLDEVHRLPPEGQEMLFSLMDRGNFRRLGESNSIHEANVLIISATTENPEKSVLTTFLRRIPCIIRIPGLAERPLKERLQLICAFFTEESKKIKLLVTVSTEVLKLFLLYDCKGNIGQLKNDIQISCANAFVEYISENQSRIYIKLSQMTDRFREGIFTLNKKQELLQTFDLNLVGELTFNAEACNAENPLKKILLHDDYRTEEDFYESILATSRKYFEEEKSIEEIKKAVNQQVENYFNKHPYTQLRKTIDENKSILTKFVQEKIVNVVQEILSDVSKDLHITFDNKIVYGLALHIENLLERIKNGNYHYKSNSTIDTDALKEEYAISQKIKNKLEDAFQIKIPKEEATFIAMFLYALNNNHSKDFLAVLVMAHGDTTASSMTNVANQLLGTDHVKSIDMPLTAAVNETLNKAIQVVQSTHSCKGVLLLVDMGSLESFADLITKSTGIPTKTVKRVSTPMVIEAARKSMMPNMTLDTLAEEVENASMFIGQNLTWDTTLPESAVQNSILDPSLLHADSIDWFSQDRDRMMKLLEEVLTFLNPSKAYDLLNHVYSTLLDKLHIVPDRRLKVKFIFHNMGMVERVISHETFENTKLKNLKITQKKNFLIIKKEFKIIENAFGIKIPDSEFAYIVEMLQIYL